MYPIILILMALVHTYLFIIYITMFSWCVCVWWVGGGACGGTNAEKTITIIKEVIWEGVKFVAKVRIYLPLIIAFRGLKYPIIYFFQNNLICSGLLVSKECIHFILFYFFTSCQYPLFISNADHMACQSHNECSNQIWLTLKFSDINYSDVKFLDGIFRNFGYFDIL